MNGFLLLNLENIDSNILTGESILRKRSLEINLVDESIKGLAKQIKTTMKEHGVESASAVIFGSLVRLVVIDTSSDEKPLFLINPKIIDESDEFVTIEESCLLFPGSRVSVSRPKLVQIQYVDLDGNTVKLKPNEHVSRLLLHEIDHLEGHLLFEHIENLEEKKKFLEDHIKNEK